MNEDLKITLGVEEEFFLVDPNTRDLLADPDPGILTVCEQNSGPHKVVTEFLRSQIEANTRVCTSISEVRTALIETRQIVIEGAAQYGAAVIAASTHPFASWSEQMPTPKERYEEFAVTYQESVRRLLIGGMHIHASFGNPDERIRVMTALRRYLPLAPRAIHLVAIQRREPHRLQVLSPEHLQCPPAHRPSRPPVFSCRIRATRKRLPAPELHRRRR